MPLLKHIHPVKAAVQLDIFRLVGGSRVHALARVLSQVLDGYDLV